MLIGSATEGQRMEVNVALRSENVNVHGKQEEKTASPAYQVELKGPEETFKTHWLEHNGTGYLLHRGGQSKEAELAELEASLEALQTRRPSFGGPVSANARLDNFPEGMETVELDSSALITEPNPLTQIIRWANEQLRQDLPEIKIDAPPGGIYTVKSRHYTWTYKGGIVENAGGAKANIAEEALKNTMKKDLSDTISSILKPYDTYSEAVKVLHDNNMSVTIYDQGGDDILRYTKELSGGLFGQLGAQLNDYVKNFGKDDDFLKEIRMAFDNLKDADGELNPLLKQMDKMVEYVQGGGEIDIKGPNFQQEVKEAVLEAYKKKKSAKDVKPEEKEKQEEPQKQGFTYLDQLQQHLSETAELMDKMIVGDKKEDPQPRTAGDVLASRAPDDNFNPEEHKKLAHVGEETQPEYKDSGIFDKKKDVDALSADTTDVLQALQSGWETYVREHELIDEENVVKF